MSLDYGARKKGWELELDQLEALGLLSEFIAVKWVCCSYISGCGWGFKNNGS